MPLLSRSRGVFGGSRGVRGDPFAFFRGVRFSRLGGGVHFLRGDLWGVARGRGGFGGLEPFCATPCPTIAIVGFGRDPEGVRGGSWAQTAAGHASQSYVGRPTCYRGTLAIGFDNSTRALGGMALGVSSFYTSSVEV